MNGTTDKNSINRRIKPFQDPITPEDVKIIVKRSLGTTTKIVNYYVRSYSEEKVGFMGAHRHLVVTVQRPDIIEKEIKIYFLKAMDYDNAEQVAVIQECNFFYKESTFYRKVIPELMSGVKDKSWTAQCYLTKDDALVFEDLKDRNFAVKSKLLDIAALKSGLTSLARLHASSILAEKRLGKTFLQLYPELCKEALFTRSGKFYDFFRSGVSGISAVAKNLGLDNTCVPKICNRIFEAIGPSKTRRNVVNHGDAWSFNMMFDDSQPLPKCVLVDWQMVRYTSAMNDLLQMLYQTTRREFREKNEEELLRHYHEVLCKTLREQDKEMDIPTFSEILQEYEEMRVVGVVTAALNFQVNLVDGKLCAELTKDSDGFSKFMFQDRVDLILDIMQKDSYYNERITEIVRELIERSKQLL